jgi:hypothetical protein
MTVRLTMRILAYSGLAVFALGLLYDIALYLRNPCPTGFGQLAFYFLPGLVAILTVPLALFGIAVAATLAFTRRQWGWFAGLLVAAGACLLFLNAQWDPEALLSTFPATGLTWVVDHVLGATCGGQSSVFSKAFGLSLPLLVAPLALHAYSYSSASSPAVASSARAVESALVARRLLRAGAVIALALGLLLGGLRLLSYLQLANVSPFETTPGMISRYYGNSPFNTPAGMRVAFLISPVGTLLAFVLGGIGVALAVRRRKWGWFAGLLAVELVTLLIAAGYYGSQPAFYVPILYRWPALALISVALPIPLPLATLAYVWWSGDQPQSQRAVMLPAPNPAL